MKVMYMKVTKTNIGIATFTDIDLLLMEYPTETLPVSENEEEIEETVSEDESLVLFPKSIVKVYSEKKAVRKAKGEYTCAFSGAPIHKGSDYVIFRPMIKDITKKQWLQQRMLLIIVVWSFHNKNSMLMICYTTAYNTTP